MAPGALIKSTVIFVLACGVYHNSLPNDFAFDGRAGMFVPTVPLYADRSMQIT